MSLELTNLNPNIGSVVHNFDLASATVEEMQQINEVLGERKVLVFHDQQLTRDQHRNLGQHFGTGRLHTHALTHATNGDIPNDVFVVRTNADSKFTAGEGWHTDVSCDKNPIAVSMLYVTEVPKSGGGDTMFLNSNLAYETLSAPIKEMVAKLSAWHDGAFPYKTIYGMDPADGGRFNANSHPIVIKHPYTGEPILWVNRGFTTHIEGLSLVEREHLLNLLFAHLERSPQLQVRVQWEPNTLVMWDNIATQHHAIWDYFPESRYGERVSVVGHEISGYFD